MTGCRLMPDYEITVLDCGELRAAVYLTRDGDAAAAAALAEYATEYDDRHVLRLVNAGGVQLAETAGCYQ